MVTTAYTPGVDELVAIGAAIASNCRPCLKTHVERARALGVPDADIARAVATADMVRQVPAKAVLERAGHDLGRHVVTESADPPCGCAGA